MQAVQRIAQERVVVALHRIDARKDHRFGGFVGRKSLDLTERGRDGHGVTYMTVFDVLEACSDVANLTGCQFPGGDQARLEVTNLQYLGGAADRHHCNPFAFAQLSIDDTYVGDDPLVRVVVRVEDERT